MHGWVQWRSEYSKRRVIAIRTTYISSLQKEIKTRQEQSESKYREKVSKSGWSLLLIAIEKPKTVEAEESSPRLEELEIKFLYQKFVAVVGIGSDDHKVRRKGERGSEGSWIENFCEIYYLEKGDRWDSRVAWELS